MTRTDKLDTLRRTAGPYAAMACGVMVFDADAGIVDANSAAEEILGVSFDQMRGKALPNLVWHATREDGSDMPREEHPCLVALRTGQAQRDVALGLSWSDAERRWLRIDAVPVFDDAGAVVQVVSSFIDLTDRKKAEERLRLMEGVVVHANDGVIITEAAPLHLPGPRIVYVNDAFTRMTGYTLDEAVGRTPRILQGPRSDRRTLDHMRAAFDAGLPVRVEVLDYRKDGSTLWVEMSVAPLTDGLGRATHFVSVQRDITERKELEARLRHQSLHDALTGLPNRALLHDRLDQALLVAGRDAGSLALLLMDLDRFKRVNDTLGHQYGDLLLQGVSQRLHGALRASDTVARLGGDEFAVVLPAIDEARAIGVVRYIGEALVEPFMVEEHRLSVAASIGMALYPAHGHDGATLLRRADMAMYAAKRARSGYAVAE